MHCDSHPMVKVCKWTLSGVQCPVTNTVGQTTKQIFNCTIFAVANIQLHSSACSKKAVHSILHQWKSMLSQSATVHT